MIKDALAAELIMAVGDLHQFGDGYKFHETLHGPMVLSPCDRCGKPTLEAEYRSRQKSLERDPVYNLCTGCLRDRWGLSAAANVRRKMIIP